MIGLDTNILLRLFFKDNPEQSEKVAALIRQLPEVGPGYVNCITLMEFAWYLRQRGKLSRSEVMEGISDLLDTQDIIMEDEHLIEATLAEMANSNSEFPDVFIALRNGNAGCIATKTLDQKAAARIPGMELLT
ncbi:PIN domain-containing protein [Mycoplana ramosa]|uniref:PIN domain-containing protein n=1 Tax=Mycoplana ramosa TaxID=40837 RepID=A0ABW3YWB9_MYCRA